MTETAELLVASPILVGGAAWWSIWKPDRWLTLFFICALLLPPLPLAFGDSGVHIAPLAALLGILAGILRITEWRSSGGTLPLAFVLFLAVITESVAMAAIYSGWTVAAGSLARVFLFAVGVYVFLYTLLGPFDTDPIAFTRFLLGLGTAGALFACIDCCFQFPSPARHSAQYVWLAGGVFRRAQGVFYEASTLGNFCAFFLVMIFVALNSKPRICSRAVLALSGIVFAAALILSSSRASVVTVVVAGCVFVTIRNGKSGNLIVGSSILLGVAALTVHLVLPGFFSNYSARIGASLQYLWSSPDGVLSGRVSSWKTLVDFLVSHPAHAIFGIGYKTTPYTDYLGAPVVADNTYLSLLVETGVVGLTAFLFLNAAILRTAWRARESFFGAWMFCFWCGEMIQMLSGDLITYWRVLPLYFWVLAVTAREVQA